MITKKSISLVLSMFILMVLAVPSGGVFQTAAAQSLEDDDDAEDELEQEADNDATTIEDSSADDNVLENENELGDDLALIDQDNEADEDAANLGVQDQEATQELEQEQDAVNANLDFDIQVGQQIERQPPPPPVEEEPPTIPEEEPPTIPEEEPPTQAPGTPGTPGTPPPPPPPEDRFFCVTFTTEGGSFTFCHLTEASCEASEELFRPLVTEECHGVPTPPPGANCPVPGQEGTFIPCE